MGQVFFFVTVWFLINYSVSKIYRGQGSVTE